MSFLHITNQTEDSSDINLFSMISDGAGQSFINEFNFLDSLELNQINVRINSKGGDVFEGFGILSAIRNAKTKVVTINEGIAASTAGWILAAGNERHAVDFSQTMAHNPALKGEKATPEQQKMLNKIAASIVKIFVNNTKMDEAKAKEIMDKTTFMTAKEALKNGIIDKIISTKRTIKDSISPDDLFELVYNNFEEKNEKPKIMKLITNHLELNEESNESSVLNVIKANEQKAADELKSEKDAHKVTSDDLTKVENELKELKSSTVEATVENAIESGKIKKEDKEKMIKLAGDAPEAFNSILESIQPARQKLADTIDNSASATTELKKDWTIRDYEKKDPTALNEMRLNDFENYSVLFEATYKVKPTK